MTNREKQRRGLPTRPPLRRLPDQMRWSARLSFWRRPWRCFQTVRSVSRRFAVVLVLTLVSVPALAETTMTPMVTSGGTPYCFRYQRLEWRSTGPTCVEQPARLGPPPEQPLPPPPPQRR